MSKQFFKNISKLHSILKPGLQSPKFTKCNKINLFYFDVRSYSTEKVATAAKFVASHASPQSAFRCSVNNPLEHSEIHLGKFYQIDPKEAEIFDPIKDSLAQDHYDEFKAFNENSLMIRTPAIEIINYLKKIDLSKPTYRFILYGLQNGTGKKCSLFHLLHYAHKDNWLIVHLPDCSKVLRMAKESQPSIYKDGRLDTPIEAAIFLKRFSTQNSNLLKNLNLKTTKTYRWGERDKSVEGTPILDLIEYAKTNAKYASDICGAITREIKLQSNTKKFKVFVGINNLNSYFGPTRLKRLADKSDINVDDITIARNFKKMLKNDWTNAVVVGTVTSIGVIIPSPYRKSKSIRTTINYSNRKRVKCSLHYEGPLTPAHLLKSEGFNYMEPFVPVEVPSYSKKELLNHYEYYRDRNWIQNDEALTEEGLEELIFLSGYNPEQFKRVIKPI